MLSESTLAALAIIGENSFWLSELKYPSNVKKAAEHYLESSVARNVSTQIQTSFGNRLRISEIDSFSDSEYNDEIAIPMADLVINNLLRMFHLHFNS